MRIGDLARRAGVGVETVRFYEREGLLQEPPRRGSGYREYPPESVVRLRFIRHAKALGFSLPEIQELLSLRYSETSLRRRPAADRGQDRGRAPEDPLTQADPVRKLLRLTRSQDFRPGCVARACRTTCLPL
jgi:DNA-binding transcriptional MerR regulator